MKTEQLSQEKLVPHFAPREVEAAVLVTVRVCHTHTITALFSSPTCVLHTPGAEVPERAVCSLPISTVYSLTVDCTWKSPAPSAVVWHPGSSTARSAFSALGCGLQGSITQQGRECSRITHPTQSHKRTRTKGTQRYMLCSWLILLVKLSIMEFITLVIFLDTVFYIIKYTHLGVVPGSWTSHLE